MVIVNDVVYPGYAVSANEYGGSGFVYSTVYYPAIPDPHNNDDYGDGIE